MSIHPEGGKYFFTFSLKKDLITIFKNIQKYSNAPPQPLSSGEWAARAGFFLNFTLLLFFFLIQKVHF
jgi:hypothetical protein